MSELSQKPVLEPKYLPRLGRHLAHELNNPISAISSAAYLIQDFMSTAEDGKLETELIKPFIESIREECARLKTIVEEFARFVTTESVLKMPMDLSEFVKMRAAEMSREGMPVRYEGDTTPITLEADAGSLQVVIKGLVQFATLSGATDVLLLARDGEKALIELTDNRTGMMDQAAIDDLFNPMPEKRSTGLGLKMPLIKRIVELHGGEIDFTMAEGSGAKFRIVLPKS